MSTVLEAIHVPTMYRDGVILIRGGYKPDGVKCKDCYLVQASANPENKMLKIFRGDVFTFSDNEETVVRFNPAAVALQYEVTDKEIIESLSQVDTSMEAVKNNIAMPDSAELPKEAPNFKGK